ASLRVTGTGLRPYESARNEPVARELAPIFPAVRTFAKGKDHPVSRVHDRYPSGQIRDQEIAAKCIKMARVNDTQLEPDVLAVQREILKPVVGAIRHKQEWFFAARVHHEPVGAFYFSRGSALATEGPQILSLLVVLDDAARSVSVANVDIRVWRDRDVRRRVLGPLSVGAWSIVFRLGRVPQRL